MPTVNFYCVLCGSALQISSESTRDYLKCERCSHDAPVPRTAHEHHDSASAPPVFPPEVLELLVKFQCTACRAELYADARSEGRDVVCSTCKVRTRIPRWSDRLVRRGMRSSTRAHVPTLSAEEMDFLRGSESGQPGVTA
jgi:DNA-directed RNA polymerase subunit RPC12/RpoP